MQLLNRQMLDIGNLEIFTQVGHSEPSMRPEGRSTEQSGGQVPVLRGQSRHHFRGIVVTKIISGINLLLKPCVSSFHKQIVAKLRVITRVECQKTLVNGPHLEMERVIACLGEIVENSGFCFYLAG